MSEEYCRCATSRNVCERHAAERIGVSEMTLRRARASRSIEFMRVGTRILYTPEAIEDFESRHTVAKRTA